MALDPITGLQIPEVKNAAAQPNAAIVQPTTPALQSPSAVQPTVTAQPLAGAPTVSTYGVTPGAAATAEPALRAVQSNETVQGQIAGLIDKNSPLLQQARNQAMMTANARGLINTSIAASAGESAAYGAALPIAQADARAYEQAARDQQALLSQTGQFNVGQANEMARATLAAQTQAEQFNAEQQNRILSQNLDAANRTSLATIEANYKTLMQSSASASDIYKQSLANITNITMNPDMDATAKQAAVNQQVELLRDGMAVSSAINGLNLQDILTFSAPSAGSPTAVAAPTAAQSAPTSPLTSGLSRFTRGDMGR